MGLLDTITNTFSGGDDPGLGAFLFGGKGESTLLGDVLPFGTLGLMQMLQGQSQGKINQQNLADQRAFSSEEAQKNRDLELLMAQMGLQGQAGLQGQRLGLEAELARMARIQRALESAQASKLAGSNQKISTLSNMINAIQRGLA